MTTKHLDSKQLSAIYHGDTEDFAALEHLSSCARCKKTFDDSGWVRVLQRATRLVEAGPHLDPDELGAYRHTALASHRVKQIEQHLRSCSRCLAFYQRSRTEEQTQEYRSPRPAQLRQAQRSFRPGRLRWLGTVLVTGLPKGPKAILLPERRVASGPGLFAGEAPFPGESAPPTRESRHGGHPASAGRRAERLLGAEIAASLEPPDASEPLCVRADDWKILIDVPSDDGSSRLGVRLVAVGDKHRASGIRVLVQGPNDEQVEATTDPTGRARLPVVRGRSRIVVEVDPPLALNLTLLD